MNVKLSNFREIDHYINIVLDAKQDIVFKKQDDIFKLLKVKKDQNQHAFYPIKDTSFALWFPIVSGKPEKCNNYIDASGNEIQEVPINTKNNKSIDTRGLYRIVFGKYKDGLKFIGVFIDSGKKRKTNIYKKISDIIILNPKMN